MPRKNPPRTGEKRPRMSSIREGGPVYTDLVRYWCETRKTHTEIAAKILADHGVDLAHTQVRDWALRRGLLREARPNAEHVAPDVLAKWYEYAGNDKFGRKIPRTVSDNPVAAIRERYPVPAGGFRMGVNPPMRQ